MAQLYCVVEAGKKVLVLLTLLSAQSCTITEERPTGSGDHLAGTLINAALVPSLLLSVEQLVLVIILRDGSWSAPIGLDTFIVNNDMSTVICVVIATQMIKFSSQLHNVVAGCWQLCMNCTALQDCWYWNHIIFLDCSASRMLLNQDWTM